MSYLQDVLVPSARALDTRKGDWSSAEIAILRKMAAQGYSAREIGNRIRGLPETTIRSRAKKYGIRLHAGHKAHFGEQTVYPSLRYGSEAK